MHGGGIIFRGQQGPAGHGQDNRDAAIPHQLAHLHHVSGELFILTIGLHMLLHWKWLVNVVGNLFSSRNIIGTKGIEIGVQSAGLAIKAVGGAFVLIANGFDEEAEEEFNDKMEYEAKQIEQKADEIEKEADEFEYQIDVANEVEWKIKREISELDDIDLYVDKDALSISVD